ncbi:MAG TPA: hypothetical protein VFH73_01385, partial [Polyangia bacterium]|nr:hypothetical protein [Polyangia bacterium]
FTSGSTVIGPLPLELQPQVKDSPTPTKMSPDLGSCPTLGPMRASSQWRGGLSGTAWFNGG